MNSPVMAPLLLGMIFHFAAQLGAQEVSGSQVGGKTTPASPRFFQNPIDYWQRGVSYEERDQQERKSASPPSGKVPPTGKRSDWGQLVTLPDGTLAYHDLPKPLVAVLEDPSPDHIRAYFEWRLARTQKILRAAELMKEFRASESAKAGGGDHAPPLPPAVKEPDHALPPAGPTPAPGPSAANLGGPFTVKYFHKQGCPHCDSQDVILAEWLRANPGGKLEAVEFGSNPELWRAFQVRGTPSLAIECREGRKAVFLEGLSRSEALDRALAEVRLGAPSQAFGNGDKKK